MMPNPARRFLLAVLAISTLLAPLAARPALAWQTVQHPAAQATAVAPDKPPPRPLAAHEAIDAQIEEAWFRNGCHLNPGNPACLAVGRAASCASAAADPTCATDSDGDRCVDVAEVLTRLDPFNRADCIGGRAGKPPLNCLFSFGNLTCTGRHIASVGCSAPMAHDDREGHLAGNCRMAPADRCTRQQRDPTCDGFAPSGN